MKRVRIAERQNDTLADDLLWGAKAIATYLGLEIGQVYHFVAKKRLPITKLSRGILVARKSELESGPKTTSELHKHFNNHLKREEMKKEAPNEFRGFRSLGSAG